MDSFEAEQSQPQERLSRGLLVALVVIVGLIVGRVAVDFITEWLWFDSLGLLDVFITRTFAQVGLFVAGLGLFLTLFAVNVRIARRIASRTEIGPRLPADGTWIRLSEEFGPHFPGLPGPTWFINVVTLAVALSLGFIVGLLTAAAWLPVLRFLNRVSFGIAEPAFGRDVGFYVFTMPVLEAALGWLFTVWMLSALATLTVYLIAWTCEKGLPIDHLWRARHVRAHLLLFLAVAFLLLAGNHLLGMFDLIRSTRGAAYGASYTDVNAQRIAQLVLVAAALLAAAACVLDGVRGGYRATVVAACGWLAAVVAVGWAIPTMFQNLVVEPNELDRERPFIGATLRFTRRAFDLDRMEQQPVLFEEAVTPQALAENRETVTNIRLWDPRPLLDTYKQIQTIRQYYQFDDVDVDRYQVNGEYRQVMAAARELVSDQLPREAQSWVAQQLQYTHGYGLTMSRVNLVTQEGLPELMVRDVPPTGAIPIPRPEIYFGLKTDHYVVTRTSTPEFDYPGGDQGVFVARYEGDAGIATGSFLRRLLFALKFQDVNFLLNTSFQEESQLHFRRNVVERAMEIVPFLRLDPDPYIVATDGGLYWVNDAYTVSDRYPYSEPYQPPRSEADRRQGPFNYIRNSVKIVTNAYDGTVRFYVADPSDPLIQSYQRIFPSLFSPPDQVPPAIRAHFRYPEGLFRAQAEKFRLFHTQDERVFYLREDQWTVANELYTDHKQPVEPYYVTMQLPGQSRPEFVLMLPFTPANRDNMIGWLAARSDEPHYGKMIVYEYPKDKVIYGPFQVETRIDQDPAISAQFSLWNQAGSQVIRGNLLTIPIGQSNLYVEPIYLQATASPLPELKRVVVSTGNRIVMEPTLSQALDRLFEGVASPSAVPTPTGFTTPRGPAGSAATMADMRELAAQAQDQFERAEQALPDFERYGQELRELKGTLDEMVRLSGPDLP